MAPFIKSSFGNKNYFLIILRKLNEINYNILKPPGTPHHVDSVTVHFFEFFFSSKLGIPSLEFNDTA